MNELEKIQASAELGYFVGKALSDINRGLQYGFNPSFYISDEDTKEAIDAANNIVKVFSNNKEEIDFCDGLANIAKWFVDNYGRR